MITKLNIDALVASKTDLYKSNEHFKYFNMDKMYSTIRNEIESLCDLANPAICMKRCNHFNLDYFKIIEAMPNELDDIYMMGFDAWSEGVTESDYLNLCQSSPKYAKGKWYVLKSNDELLSSLIIYKFDRDSFGIGSISTPALLRKKGFASKLILGMVEILTNDYNVKNIFLYSDINPVFYEKFGFVKLPKRFQRYKTTECMVRGNDLKKYLSGEIDLPEYF